MAIMQATALLSIMQAIVLVNGTSVPLLNEAVSTSEAVHDPPSGDSAKPAFQVEKTQPYPSPPSLWSRN